MIVIEIGGCKYNKCESKEAWLRWVLWSDTALFLIYRVWDYCNPVATRYWRTRESCCEEWEGTNCKVLQSMCTSWGEPMNFLLTSSIHWWFNLLHTCSDIIFLHYEMDILVMSILKYNLHNSETVRCLVPEIMRRPFVAYASFHDICSKYECTSSICGTSWGLCMLCWIWCPVQIACAGEVVKGDAGTWIVDEGNRLSADIIVVGSRGGGVLKR